MCYLAELTIGTDLGKKEMFLWETSCFNEQVETAGNSLLVSETRFERLLDP